MPIVEETPSVTLVSGHGWQHMAVLCLAVWLHAADTLLTATVMPSAVAEIGGIAFFYWTLALYQLGSVLAGVAAALLTSRLGLRAAMVIAALVYAVGCVGSAVAPDMAVMLVGRTLQGFGGGWLVALAYIGVTSLYPPQRWPTVTSRISAVWGSSALIGPLIGGAFATAGAWRGAFFAFAAQAVGFAGLAMRLSRGDLGKVRADPPPWLRLSLVIAGMMAILTAGIRPQPALSIALLTAGSSLLLLTLHLDSRAQNRLLPLNPFSRRTPWGLGYITAIALSVSLAAFMVYGPLLMEALFGVTPFVAGLMVAGEAVAWSLAALAFSRTSARAEAWVIRCGTLLVAVGLIGFVFVMPRGPLGAVLACAVMQGAGGGMAWSFIMRRIVANVAPAERERASSAVPTLQMIGYALGASLAGIVANVGGLAMNVADAPARRVASWMFGVFLPVAVLMIWSALRLSTARQATFVHDLEVP